MDLTILTEIDSSIVLGIAVSVIVMSLAVLYDRYNGGKGTNSNTSISNSFEMLGQLIDFSSFNVSNPFAGLGQKIKKLINRDSNSKENEVSELAADSGSNDSGIKGIFGNLRSKVSSIKLSLPEKSNRENKAIFGDIASSKNAAFTEKESNLNFDVDEIIGNKKNELDFDDNLINEMATGGSLGSKTEVAEPDSDLSLNSDLSIDMGEFDFGFGEGGDKQDDGLDNDFTFEIPVDDSPDDEFLQVVPVDDFSLDDDNDNFIEALKNDLIIDEVEKVNFMSEMGDVSLDLGEIKTELEELLANLKRYNAS